MSDFQQPKFRVGQKVYFGLAIRTPVGYECPDCLGTGKWAITTPAGESWDTWCQTCSSSALGLGGRLIKYEWQPEVVIRTIGSIRMDTNSKEDLFEYMCKETGIGSGNIYKESSLFRSESEALAYAEMEVVRFWNIQEKEQEDKKDKKRKAAVKQKPHPLILENQRLTNELDALKNMIWEFKNGLRSELL